MEGAWRARRCWFVAAMAGLACLASGCGDDGADGATSTVKTPNPVATFAPVVNFSRDERFLPTGARFFLERSELWLGHRDDGCADQRVAVGQRLLGSSALNAGSRLFIAGIGWGPTYWREAYVDDTCDRAREEYRYYANQLTRPNDPSAERAAGLRPEEGYFLDLADGARGGPPIARDGAQAVVAEDAFYGQRPVQIDGEPGLRLTYWMLYGMDRPLGPRGAPVKALTREGDWERVEVLLREGADRLEWEPVAVRLADGDGGWRTVPWSRLRLAGPTGGDTPPTHPELFAALGSHTLYPRPGRHERQVATGFRDQTTAVLDQAAKPCADCPRWDLSDGISFVRRAAWYGFGGAWGDIGPTSERTGPLGPHDDIWPEGDPAAQIERSEQRPGASG